MFDTTSCFNLNLIFDMNGRVESRLWLNVTNTLAFYNVVLIMAAKRFIVETADGLIKKLFAKILFKNVSNDLNIKPIEQCYKTVVVVVPYNFKCFSLSDTNLSLTLESTDSKHET